MKKVYFETYGCSHNQADTESMKYSMTDSYIVTEDMSEADAIVINTCSVKDRTVHNLKKRLKELKQDYPKKKIIFTGCLVSASKPTNYKEFPELKNYSLLGTNNIADINKVLEATTAVELVDIKKNNPIIGVKGRTIEVIPISTGCLSTCTYCQTKFSRGQLASYRPNDICAVAKSTRELGTKIIYLTSQDNGCYGFDINTHLPDLLRRIIKENTDLKIRIGMANPVHVKEIIGDLLEVMKSKQIFKFLHIPLQSGSNDVLDHMKRENSVEEFKAIIKEARQAFPKITIATDIIVGYPSETKEHFEETIALLKDVKPDVVNRAKYAARPGTKAARMKQVSTNEKTRRSKILTKVVQEVSLEKNKEWIGWQGKVIIEAIKREGSAVARNESYKPIVLKGEFKEGDTLKVKITDCTDFHLIGEELN